MADITVFGRPPGYDRFKIARDIQDACNPAGVAHELLRVIQDAQEDKDYTGTRSSGATRLCAPSSTSWHRCVACRTTRSSTARTGRSTTNWRGGRDVSRPDYLSDPDAL